MHLGRENFMSKYTKLWEYVKVHCTESLTLTFEEIKSILGFEIDHSFLKYKKELAEYGCEVGKISMKNKTVDFARIKKDTLVLYIHGKGGNASEAEHYKRLFPNCDVVGLDYRSGTPWAAEEEFSKAYDDLSKDCKHIVLIANSIGAYFAMHAIGDKKIDRAYFISPIVDMEKLICDMINWANVTEKEFKKEGCIKTDFGETLSWEYLCYVRKNPIYWSIPTEILYGENDNLTSKETISDFCAKNNFSLTIMDNGEHWFHTDEQMKFLDHWIKRSEANI